MMHTLDWIVIAAYLAGVIALGAVLSLRASASADAYLVADRKLPWWVIGFSDVASAAGGDAYWVFVIYTGAFMGLYRVWWVGVVVGVPLAILWARYWRRLALVSSWEFYEVRYGGRAAGYFRGFTAVYAALVTSVVILAYVLQAFAQVMAPFLGWDVDTVLLVFGGASALYTLMSGLLGVAYSDVPQFLLLMCGRIALAMLVIAAAGGVGPTLDVVDQLRGIEFMKPSPPGVGEVYGSFQVEPMTLVALVMAGLLGFTSMKSVSVQRSLAARSEADAALGQMFAAVLTLGVRVVPLVFIGVAAVALYDGDTTDAAAIWADMVMQYAAPGLVGLILVGVVAGYMSTIDTYLNFLTAGLFNDFYRRHLRPDSGPREQLWFCRGATLIVAAVAVLWANLLIESIDARWLNFINSVIGLFVLPLAALRWLWWRMNIWGELVGLLVGYPLAWAVWFPMGYSEEPYWKSFLVLAGLGWVVITLVTLATPPEKPETLDAFYARVRPPGLWGPVKARYRSRHPERTDDVETRSELYAAGAGLVFCSCLVLSIASGFARQPALFAGSVAGLAGSGVAYYRFLLRAQAARAASAADDDGARGETPP